MPARTALLLGCTAAALRSGRPPPAQKKPWKPQLLDAEPAPAPPRVLHRDADVVVVDKPSGWSVDAVAAFVADLLGAAPRVGQANASRPKQSGSLGALPWRGSWRSACP